MSTISGDYFMTLCTRDRLLCLLKIFINSRILNPCTCVPEHFWLDAELTLPPHSLNCKDHSFKSNVNILKDKLSPDKD